ncbi:MAG: hypothetical protein WC834_00030 [Eubacteriales bacterium]
MTYLIIGMILGLWLFVATITAYTLGLRHGKMLVNGVVPQINLNPVKAVLNAQQAIQTKRDDEKQKKTDDLISQGLANILAYDGTPQKEATEEGE